MNSARHSLCFPKAEHLCSRKLIERLYAEGQRVRVFPYSVHWLLVDELPVPCQVMIVAPKRKFHHAVDRNRVRRLTRECYRLSKAPLLDTLARQGKHLIFSLVYEHNELPSFESLAQRMDKVVSTLMGHIADPE